MQMIELTGCGRSLSLVLQCCSRGVALATELIPSASSTAMPHSVKYRTLHRTVVNHVNFTAGLALPEAYMH